MFSTLVHLFTGRATPGEVESGFVTFAPVTAREPRSPRVERIILLCWVLVAFKHVLILWASRNYAVPFDPLWVNLPTWLLGVLATTVYFARIGR